MNACDDFEVLLEMRLHGALAPEALEARALVAHLATCTSCRAFEELANESEQIMNQQVANHVQSLDWDGLWQRTKRLVEWKTREGILVSMAITAAIVPAVIMFGDRVLVGLTVGAWAAGAVWRATTARRELAAAASYQGDTGELLFFYRRELENRLRSTQVALVLPLACALLIVRRLLHPFATINQTLGFAGLTAVLLASSAYVWFVRRPRLVRELAALKADLGKR